MLGIMKTLSPSEIECLLGIRPTNAHPLDILGYGCTPEGARRFRAEQPDFFAQIAAYVEEGLDREGIFPTGTDPDNPGSQTCIQAAGTVFRVSSMEQVGPGKLERFHTNAMPEDEAVREYILKVADPHYIHAAQLVS